MFKIIGADQKEYGPVSTTQIRQWITDGRLSAATQAQRATGGGWQPLSAFEEFADIFNPAGTAPTLEGTPTQASAPSAFPGAPIPTAAREMALSAVKGPAIALIIIAGIGIALYLFGTLAQVIGLHHPMSQDLSKLPPYLQGWVMRDQGMGGILSDLLGVLLNAAVLLGAIRIRRLQNHTFAIITCIIAMVPCNCCCFLFNIPFAIWGLIMLNKPDVKSQFTN